MTELQKTELELLRVFTEICESLNLRYYLVCGSALGAVKYKGFIPWDDDIDVALPRADYDILIEKAQALLPEHLFLQNYHTDPGFTQFYSKLRNSNTTYIEKSVAHLPIHHGVYIDIFPLDGHPSDPGESCRFERKKRFYERQISCVYEVERTIQGKVLCAILRLLGCHKRTRSTVAALDAHLSRVSPEESALWCNYGNWQGRLEYAPREQYGAGAWAEFEGLRVRIPEDWDAYLTQKYGDWQADLPPEQQIGHHYYSVCDCNIPYKYYLEKKGG